MRTIRIPFARRPVWPGLTREQQDAFAVVYGAAVAAAPIVAMAIGADPDLQAVATHNKMVCEFSTLLADMGCPESEIDGELECIVMRARTLAEHARRLDGEPEGRA